MDFARLLQAKTCSDRPGNDRLLNLCGSDQLYKKLCHAQESFRARLSPKPRRLQMQAPGINYPFASPSESTRLAKWLHEYQAKSRDFATCEFVKNIGIANSPLPEFLGIIELHDQETRSTEKRFLR